MSDEDEKHMADLKKRAVSEIAEHYDADVMFYMGNLFPNHDRDFMEKCRAREKKRKNVLLILATPGGSADSAYRISHCLQRQYSEEKGGTGSFLIYAPDFCKSAGTILALGADRLIMSQVAELGPIDVQLRKEEEVGEWASGLNATEALAALREQSLSMFFRTFRDMRFDRELGFSTRVSTEVASNLTIGLMQPMYSQIDPVRLGELQRFVRISLEYGERLATSNVKKGAIEQLVVGYPSHGFIIDRSEARNLFNRVEKPIDQLEIVGQMVLNDAIRGGAFDDERSKPRVEYLNEERKEDGSNTTQNSKGGKRRAASGAGKTVRKRTRSTPSDKGAKGTARPNGAST